MILNYLKVSLQSGSFGKCVPRLPGQILSIGQIELFDHLNCEQTNDWYSAELLEIEVFNRLNLCKQMTDV